MNLMDLQKNLMQLAQEAKVAADELANIGAMQKNDALSHIAEGLTAQQDKILSANEQDVAAAMSKGLAPTLIDRLKLDETRVQAMVEGVQAIATLSDPVGQVLAEWERPNGLHIARVSVPLGVIAVIYESRPNVTVDAAALCLKAGNAAILRSGSECFHSAQALSEAIQQGLKAAHLSPRTVQMVPTQEREAIDILIALDEYIDVVVPRGGKALIQHLLDHSRIPLFMHLMGLCHSYVHKSVDQDQAIEVICNAKMRRPGICGATETILLDKAIAKAFVPRMVAALTAANCEVRGDEQVKSLEQGVALATTEDWTTEYLAPIVAMKVVADIKEAVTHINDYGSHHTDAILAQEPQAIDYFHQHVASAITMSNCSTQFADGGEFGMGAEIGIATGKLHARGPVGIQQLTTFKYRVKGSGQVR